MKQIRSFFSVLLLGISLMMVSVPSFSADYQTGLDAYNRGDYEAALREWRPLAGQGDADARTGLGFMYDEGLGVAKSCTKAGEWYRLAAEQGHASAQNNLGLLYETLWCGVVRSNTEAVNWFRKAAEQGDPYAQLNLGRMYDLGRGVVRGNTEAVKRYRET